MNPLANTGLGITAPLVGQVQSFFSLIFTLVKYSLLFQVFGTIGGKTERQESMMSAAKFRDACFCSLESERFEGEAEEVISGQHLVSGKLTADRNLSATLKIYLLNFRSSAVQAGLFSCGWEDDGRMELGLLEGNY